MRRNHLIPVTKQNQFHSFAYSHGWKETDFYEQMTPNWRQELYIEEAQLISFLQKRNEKGRGYQMMAKFKASDDDFEDWIIYFGQYLNNPLESCINLGL